MTARPLPKGKGSGQGQAAAKGIYKSGEALRVRHAPVAAARKLAKKRSPPPPEDVGAPGSGEASPVRDAPTDGLGAAAPPRRKRFKKNKKKRKRRDRPGQEDERAENDGDRALVSLKRGEIVHGKRGDVPAGSKRAKRGAPRLQEDEEQAEKRAAGADDIGTSKALTETGAPADRVNHKMKKRRKVSPRTPQPDSAELGLTRNRKELRQGEVRAEQDRAGIISLLQVNDGAHTEKQQGETVAEQKDAHNTSMPQQNDSTRVDEDIRAVVCGEALTERNASSPNLRASERVKKPANERSWSKDDEKKILRALVKHAKSHRGALPDSSLLLANLTFDKADANAAKLSDKIRKLRARYRKLCSKGRPTDKLGRRLFNLSEALWGQVDDDVQAEATFVTSDREFSQRSSLYPYLAEEVKVYAETHSYGNSIMAVFATIGDDKARLLDAMCRKQRDDALNLELSQAKLTNAMLSAFLN